LSGRRQNYCVVAVPRENREPFALHTHFYGMVVGAAIGAAGRIGEGVLIAGFLGYTRVKVLEIAAARSVIHIAAGVVRIARQAVKLIEFSIDKNGAHTHSENRNGVAQQLLQNHVIFILVLFWSVHPVGNEDDNFAAFPPAVFEKFRGGIDGVVKCLSWLATDLDGRRRRCRPAGYRLSVDGR